MHTKLISLKDVFFNVKFSPLDHLDEFSIWQAGFTYDDFDSLA